MTMKDSRTYRRILKHRETCSKWGKSFCLECFGGGITNYTETLLREIGMQEVEFNSRLVRNIKMHGDSTPL
jgi:hypothetical protein